MNALTVAIASVVLALVYTSILGTRAVYTRTFSGDVATNPLQSIIVFPVLEEMFFRGIPLVLSDDIFSPVFVLSHIIFVIGHKQNYEKGFGWMVPRFALMSISYAYVAVVAGLEWSILFHVVSNAIGWCRLRSVHHLC